MTTNTIPALRDAVALAEARCETANFELMTTDGEDRAAVAAAQAEYDAADVALSRAEADLARAFLATPLPALPNRSVLSLPVAQWAWSGDARDRRA